MLNHNPDADLTRISTYIPDDEDDGMAGTYLLGRVLLAIPAACLALFVLGFIIACIRFP